MHARLLKYWNTVRYSYWFVPSLMAFGAIGLAIATTVIDDITGGAWIENISWLYANQPDGARALLSTIAGSMITVAGVAFSITIAAIAYASGQFGPRILTNFMGDRGNQITLGTFIATFLYCLLVLRTVRSAEEAAASVGVPSPGSTGSMVSGTVADATAGTVDLASAFVPHLSILCGLAFALASLGVLIYFIHHTPESIHISHVVADIGRELNRQIGQRFPQHIGQALPVMPSGTADIPESFFEEAVPLRARHSGYIQTLDDAGLLRQATEHDLILRLLYRPGDFVGSGQALMLVWPAVRFEEAVEEKIADAFTWGGKRTQVQDLRFLVDELVEIAARALSPGINDPFTAMNCLDWLGAALANLAGREMPSPYRYDDDKHLRLISYPVTFGGFIDAVFDRLRPYFQADRNAALHMMKVIATLMPDVVEEDIRQRLLEHAGALKDGALEQLVVQRDREAVTARYRTVLHLRQTPSAYHALVEAAEWIEGNA